MADVEQRAAAIFADAVRQRNEAEASERRQAERREQLNEEAIIEYQVTGLYPNPAPDVSPTGESWPTLVAERVRAFDDVAAEVRRVLAKASLTDQERVHWRGELSQTGGNVVWLHQQQPRSVGAEVLEHVDRVYGELEARLTEN